MKLSEVTRENIGEVSAKQCYEWVRTDNWSRRKYVDWLRAKGINPDRDVLTSGRTLIHTPDANLSYEWIKTKHWTRRKFTTWLNLKFFWEF